MLLAAAIAAAPVALHRAYFGDDLEFHLVSWMDAEQSWRHGILYPHWAPSANFGAGEPRFMFYPPLSWMLGAALGLALPWATIPGVLTFLLLAAAGFSTRALAREALPDGPATVAGCVAMFSGYSLFTAYDRAAYGELGAGIFVPLVLLFALRDRRPSASIRARALDGSALPLALAIAGAWLCDAPAGVMASYLLAAVSLSCALAARSWYPVARASIAFPIGVGLCGFYLVPAAWEQRWVDILQTIGVNGDPGMMIENNWLFAHHTDPRLMLRDADLHFMPMLAVGMVGVALLSFAVIWLRKRVSLKLNGGPGGAVAGRRPILRDSQPSILLTRRWMPLALVPVAVLFLMLPISLPLWNMLPKLRFLQFPWRWLLVLEAPMGIGLAAAVWPWSGAGGWVRRGGGMVCGLCLVLAMIFATKNFFRAGRPEDRLPSILKVARTGAGFVGTDEYAPPGADNSTVATGLPDVCLAEAWDVELGVAPSAEANPAWRPDQGSCMATAAALKRGPEHLLAGIEAPRAGYAILRLRSYPAWRVTVNGRLAANLPARVDGLIAAPVGQGYQLLAVDWTTTGDAIAGRVLSGVALLFLLWLGLAERKLNADLRVI